MLCLNTVAEVFFAKLLADSLYVVVYLAHICNGRCCCHMLWLMVLPYMNIVADVYAIVDNIGSHLVVLK